MEKFIASLFMLAAVGLGVAALATTHWQEMMGKKVHYGLFQSCSSIIPGQKLTLCASNLEGEFLPTIWKFEGNVNLKPFSASPW